MTKQMVRGVRVMGFGMAIAIAAPSVSAARAPWQQAPAAPVAAQQPLPAAREQQLRERVARWYEARRARDQRVMYDLLEPDHRAKMDFSTYVQQTAVRVRFSLLSHTIAAVLPESDDRVTVRMQLRMDLGRFGDTPVDATDRWVWRDGDWWLVFKEFEPPFPPGPDPAAARFD